MVDLEGLAPADLARAFRHQVPAVPLAHCVSSDSPRSLALIGGGIDDVLLVAGLRPRAATAARVKIDADDRVAGSVLRRAPAGITRVTQQRRALGRIAVVQANGSGGFVGSPPAVASASGRSAAAVAAVRRGRAGPLVDARIGAGSGRCRTVLRPTGGTRAPARAEMANTATHAAPHSPRIYAERYHVARAASRSAPQARCATIVFSGSRDPALRAGAARTCTSPERCRGRCAA